MKPLLTAAALLALLAGHALAEEVTNGPAPLPQEQASAEPQAVVIQPATLPQSTAPASAMPVSGKESTTASPRGGGGCHHENTVYLTN